MNSGFRIIKYTPKRGLFNLPKNKEWCLFRTRKGIRLGHYIKGKGFRENKGVLWELNTVYKWFPVPVPESHM